MLLGIVIIVAEFKHTVAVAAHVFVYAGIGAEKYGCLRAAEFGMLRVFCLSVYYYLQNIADISGDNVVLSYRAGLKTVVVLVIIIYIL